MITYVTVTAHTASGGESSVKVTPMLIEHYKGKSLLDDVYAHLHKEDQDGLTPDRQRKAALKGGGE